MDSTIEDIGCSKILHEADKKIPHNKNSLQIGTEEANTLQAIS